MTLDHAAQAAQAAQAAPKCANGHTWTHQWGDDWTPERGTPCDCGQKRWGIPLTVTRELAPTRERISGETATAFCHAFLSGQVRSPSNWPLTAVKWQRGFDAWQHHCYYLPTPRKQRLRKKPLEPLADRFWRKVQKTEGCWLWMGAKTPPGYGHIGVHGRPRPAHRVAWELTYGPIPAGLHVCHHCDNPRCVRPDHLFLGTPTDNMQDAKRKGRLHPRRVTDGTSVVS